MADDADSAGPPRTRNLPLGLRLRARDPGADAAAWGATVDVQAREGARGTTHYARVRWTHPVTHHREGVKRRTHGSLEEARAWIERLEGAARTGVDPGQPLADYVAQLGDRWARGIDPTSMLRCAEATAKRGHPKRGAGGARPPDGHIGRLLQLAIAPAGAAKTTALTRPGGRAAPRPASRGAAACTDESEGQPWPR